MKLFSNLSSRKRHILIGYTYILPWIIGFLLFTALPLLYSLYLSFQKVKITGKGIATEFIKLENYKYAFLKDIHFVEELLLYIRYLIIVVPIIICFSLLIALLINQPIKCKKIFRVIFFLPVVITSGPVIEELISQGATVIPTINQGVVVDFVTQNFNPTISKTLLYIFEQIIVVLWFSGVQILIFLAGLQKMDKAIYEAAWIDGASPWETFWKITLPSLKPLIVVATVYTIIDLSTFSLNSIVMLIKDNMFNIKTGFGYSSALAWIYFIIIALILIIAALILRANKKD